MLIDEKIEKFAINHSTPESKHLQQLYDLTYEQMECPQMLTGRLEGRFLKLIVQMLQPKFILELGTFTGYSALSMAEGLSENGKIITCEINPDAARIAQTAFDNSPYGARIELVMGPALETISTLGPEVDLTFIDADKENYPNYYEAVLRKTIPGGYILVDNVLWSGRVLDPQDAETKAIVELNQIVANDARVENVLLTIRDGIQLIRKR